MQNVTLGQSCQHVGEGEREGRAVAALVGEVARVERVLEEAVERGLLLVVFCSMLTAGERPLICSTFGFCKGARNCRA